MTRTALIALAVLVVVIIAGMLSASAAYRHHHWAHAGSRPYAWCGWFGRFNFVSRDPGPAFNLAANWRHIGSPDWSPNSGDIAVWPHHVGKIVGQCSGRMCPVWSGNDGHTVRTRMRSVSGAIFRRV